MSSSGSTQSDASMSGRPLLPCPPPQQQDALLARTMSSSPAGGRSARQDDVILTSRRTLSSPGRCHPHQQGLPSIGVPSIGVPGQQLDRQPLGPRSFACASAALSDAVLPGPPKSLFSSSLLCREQQSIAAATTYIKIERREKIPSSHRNGRWCFFWPKSLTGSIVLRKNAWAGFPANKANICLRKRFAPTPAGR